MSSHENPRHLSLSDLQDQCTQETANYFWGFVDEAWHCYEIFRRAIVEKNEEAWGTIMEQYQPQVSRWVERHPKIRLFSEEPDFFVNRIFEKFWRTNLSAKEFSRFPNVKSLMAYLKTIVASVLTDYWRVQERKPIEYLAELSRSGPPPQSSRVEDMVVNRMQRRRFWEHVGQHLTDKIEYQVVYEFFILGLKPAEIFRHTPQAFRNVQEVYKIKARAIIRLSQIVDLFSYFADNSEEME